MPSPRQFAQRYGFPARAITQFPNSERAWRVDSDHGPLILRLHDPDHQADHHANHPAEIAVLRYLERIDFPAPRLVPASDGAAITWWDKKAGYLTTFLPGCHLVPGVDSAGQLGAAIARVHLLDCAGLPDTNFNVAAKKAVFHRFDADPRIQAWEGYTEIRPKLKGAWEHLSPMTDLPRALIHTDLDFRNAVLTPVGHLILIDWEGSGGGPAIQDIGYFLAGYIIPRKYGLRPDIVRAFLAGYTSVRPLAPQEWDHLPDAVLFGCIFYVLWYSMVYQNAWQATCYALDHRDRIERALEIIRAEL